MKKTLIWTAVINVLYIAFFCKFRFTLGDLIIPTVLGLMEFGSYFVCKKTGFGTNDKDIGPSRVSSMANYLGVSRESAATAAAIQNMTGAEVSPFDVSCAANYLGIDRDQAAGAAAVMAAMKNNNKRN